jgi:hypothetical protein
MKPFMFLLLSVFILKSSNAQPEVTGSLAMSVEKISTYDDDAVILQFKPGRVLKIKTSEGKKFISRKYVLQDSAIVMHTLSQYGVVYTDTIPFQDIVRIRGKVYGNTARKAGGTILALTGVPVAAMGFVYGALRSDTATGGILMMFPGFLLTGSGIGITGARSFSTNDKWTLKTTPSVN